MSEFHEQHEAAHRRARASNDGRWDDAAGPRGQQVASALGNAQVGRMLRGPGVQRSGATSAQQLDESVARAIEERRGRGQPLGDDVRTQMEGALGRDLSDVRIHTDSTAHQLNEAVSARAFTTGSDVFFKQGTYDAGSSSGKELLAHELTHVVQQRTGASGLAPGEVSDPSDPAERHADDVGRSVASQTPAAPAPAAHAGVARQAAPDEELEDGIAAARAVDTGVHRETDDEELEQA